VRRDHDHDFKFGMTGSDILNLERQNQIFNFNLGTTGSNILKLGTTVSDLISIWERQDQIF
jgi:hypothetical protein